MHTVLLALFEVAVVMCLVGFFGYLSLGNKVALRLKDLHHSTWVELGSPDLADRYSTSKAKFIPWLSRRGYRSLSDEQLNKLGDIARALLFLSVTAMAFLLVDAFAMFFVFPLGGH